MVIKCRGPFYLIMEFAEHGSLRQHLREMRTEHSGDAWPRTILLNFATQIAGGMAYLESLKVTKMQYEFLPSTHNISLTCN